MLQAKLLFMPVQGSFLSGVAALMVFVLLLMLQSGVLARDNLYLWEEDPSEDTKQCPWQQECKKTLTEGTFNKMAPGVA